MMHRLTEDRTDNHIMETMRALSLKPEHARATGDDLIALTAQKLALDPDRIRDAINRKAKIQ